MQALASDPEVKPNPEARRRLRIALLGYRCNPFSGGQGVYIRNVSLGLANLGHQVDVISGAPYPILANHPNIKLIKVEGLNLYGTPEEQPKRTLRTWCSRINLFEWWSFKTGGFPEPYTFGERVYRLLKSGAHEYDVIHDNQTLSWGIVKLAKSSLPVITTIHHPITFDRDIALAHSSGIGSRLLIRRWHNFLNMQAKVAKSLPHIITVSENSRRDIQSAFNTPSDRLHVVPNGIDLSLYRPLADIQRQDNCIITTASADQPLKGTQYLIPALAQVRDQRPDLRVIFIGKPKEDGPTAALIEQHQLNNCIEFIHGISDAQIVELYATATLAVVPSEYEGFGLPAAEAMACGVPVVSTNGGALPEVVGDAGLVVQKSNANALAGAINRLLDDKSERESLSARGRLRIETHFSAARAAQMLEEYYYRILDQ